MSFKKKYVKELYDSQSIYDTVLDRLEIPEESLIERQFAQSNLEEALFDHIAVSTLEQADELELKALFDYKNRVYEIAPMLSETDIILEFLGIYTNLRDRIFSTIPTFLDEYVSDYLKIAKAYGK